MYKHRQCIDNIKKILLEGGYNHVKNNDLINNVIDLYKYVDQDKLEGGAKRKTKEEVEQIKKNLMDEITEWRDDIEKEKKKKKPNEKAIKAFEKLISSNEKKLDKLEKKGTKKTLAEYDLMNLKKWLLTIDIKNQFEVIDIENFLETDEKIKKKQSFKFAKTKENPTDNAFDNNKKNFKDYQKEFIENWSVSAQELCILYYGVGSGKTLIAINCAEQYVNLNPNSNAYFLCPASLVLNTIGEMIKFGINPARTNDDKKNVYYFMSYQQLLLSDFSFENNSLLIVDEAHNLRNVRSENVNVKVSARKSKKVEGMTNIKGNKLASNIIEKSNRFSRSIFMSGTLFVNSPEDLEPIISIGYKKKPLIEQDRDKYNLMMNDEELFKNYYEGLISFFRIDENMPIFKNFPTVKYEFNLIKTNDDIFNKVIQQDGETKEDSFFINSRNAGLKEKMDWVLKFLKDNKFKNQKTLIYSQFLNRKVMDLFDKLNKEGIKCKVISGELSQDKKLKIVEEYNTDQIKVLIFTLSIKEGISFLETNNFIILEPYWNYAIMEQIIARGIRLSSHKQGSKSTINVHLLVNINPENSTKAIRWSREANKIMNENIKTLEYKREEKISKDKDGNEFKTTDIKTMNDAYGSRDIYLYNIMFNKQEGINFFEKKLLKLPSFEKINNLENNEFIESFKLEVKKIQDKEDRFLTNKEYIDLKRKLYDEYYKKKIENTNKGLKRLSQESGIQYAKLSSNEVNLIEMKKQKKYDDKRDIIKKIIKKDFNLEQLFKIFGATKQDIQMLQAFFTPQYIVDELVKYSGIENDNRQGIKILEPTMGIGNVIRGLLELKNKNNMMIDGVEIYNPFFQIADVFFEGIDNLKFYNMDFIRYTQRYNYDHIIGNPPFNLKTQLESIVKKRDKDGTILEKKEYKEATLYDVDFVSMCYDMLNNGGDLTMVISDRFTRDKKGKFGIFKKYIDLMNKKYPNSVEYKKVDIAFKKSKTTTKEQETSFGMVYLKMKKIPNYRIDLSKEPEKPLDEKQLDKLDITVIEPEQQPEKEKPKRGRKKKEEVKPEVKPEVVKPKRGRPKKVKPDVVKPEVVKPEVVKPKRGRPKKGGISTDVLKQTPDYKGDFNAQQRQKLVGFFKDKFGNNPLSTVLTSTFGFGLEEGGYGLNDFINDLPFEAHLLDFSKFPPKKYSFCGPATKLNERLNPDDSVKEWSKPINNLDLGCYYHDIAYRDNKDVKNRNIADEKLSRVASDVIKNPSSISEKLNAILVKKIMDYKVKNKI
jgi:superfamily II DNA or RNA helicase